MDPVLYLTAAGQPSFTAAVPVGLPIWENPFPEDSQKLVFRLMYWQRADNWVAARFFNFGIPSSFDYPASLTLYVPATPTFYLVGEGNFQEQRGGILVWERTYAAIPATRYDYMTYPYEFPAIFSALTVGAYSAITYVSDVGGGRMFVDYTAADPGSQLSLSYRVNGVLFQNVVPVFDYASGGVVAAMDSSFLSTTYARAVAKASHTVGRQFPLALPGRAVVSYSYFLAVPGPTFAITPIARQKFTVNGEEVKFVSANTIPSAVSYLAMIATPSYFVAEDEQISRWMGNIYERKVIYVYAQ